MVRAAGSYPAGRWFDSDRRYQIKAISQDMEFCENTHKNLIRPHGQAVKTSPFHGGNESSILPGVTTFGGIAQLVERHPYKMDAIGSSPIVSTKT